MVTRYPSGCNENPHFVTFSFINLIDIFSREDYKTIIIGSLRFCIQEKVLNLHAWVIMTNHIHLIISYKAGFRQADVLRDRKKFTTKIIIKAIAENIRESYKNWLIWMFKRVGSKNSNNKLYQFWKQETHPIELTNLKMMEKSKTTFMKIL